MTQTSSELFQVMKQGALTTFQDSGRLGYQQFGVPVSGAMDPYALQIANLLVGNQRDAAVLEVTFIGPELLVKTACTIAITGAHLSPTINKQPAPMWQTVRLKKGDIIQFGRPQEGVRAYIAVAGGYAAPTMLHSQSTYTKAGLGKPLEKNEVLYGYPSTLRFNRGVINDVIPHYGRELECRVLAGIHEQLFDEAIIQSFYQDTYTVTPQADRMGYRLSSDQPLTHDIHLTSDAVANGTIQLPANGEPIVLLADRQTTGGYPIIANVISRDLPKVAQLAPGSKLRFKKVTLEEAQAELIQLNQQIKLIEQLESKGRFS